MKLLPRNRRLLVEEHSFGKEEDLEGLDTFVSSMVKEDVVFKVLLKAPDVELNVDIGDLILVEPGMVEVDGVDDEVFSTILENYVKGVLFDD